MTSLTLVTSEQGYELTFRAPKAEEPLIIEYDVPNFAHVILLASETKSTLSIPQSNTYPSNS